MRWYRVILRIDAVIAADQIVNSDLILPLKPVYIRLDTTGGMESWPQSTYIIVEIHELEAESAQQLLAARRGEL